MVADLLNLPPELGDDFDLVLEVHILQAMPVELRKIASQKLAPLVSENGFLVCIGRYATELTQKNISETTRLNSEYR